MNIDILKESYVEYCENIYALSITYLKDNSSIELKQLLKELTSIEDNIRKCNNNDDINKYVYLLKNIIDRIEGIINE